MAVTVPASSTPREKKRAAASPVDHGWAWVVCAGGCFLHIVVVGTIRSTGILLASVSEHYNRSKRDTSWIMGFMYLLFMLLTPITMALARRYTARLLVFIGGIFLSMGYTVSYFAASLEFLYVSIGLLVGVGMAMTHPPTILLVNYYFDRRRTVAMGITMAGCSVGALCMPPLMSALIDRYTFRGGMLVLGGLMLNVVVAGALMRPFVGPQPDADASAAAEATDGAADEVEKPLVAAPEEETRAHRCDRHCKSAENLHCPESACQDGLRRAASATALHHRQQQQQQRMRPQRQRPLMQPPLLLEFSGLMPPQKLTLLASCGDVSILVGQPASVAALAVPEASLAENGRRAEASLTEGDDGAAAVARWPVCGRLAGGIRALNLNLSLLRSPRVWFLMTGLALAIQGMPFNFMILPQHGKSLGMAPAEYTRLLQYQGITDFAVRIGIGFLADRQLIRRQPMLVALVLAQGALWCLLLNPTPGAALAFSLLEGVLAGGVVTNLAPILVDTCGVDNLPTTYGFMGLIESGIMLGLPVLLGDMFDKTGSWNSSIIFVSAMITFSGLMLLTDDLLHQRAERRKRICLKTPC